MLNHIIDTCNTRGSLGRGTDQALSHAITLVFSIRRDRAQVWYQLALLYAPSQDKSQYQITVYNTEQCFERVAQTRAQATRNTTIASRNAQKID